MTMPSQNGTNPTTPPPRNNGVHDWNNDSTWSSALETINQLDTELRHAFVEDANQCVNSIERRLLDQTGKHDALGTQNEICRDLHNLKGASASVGLVDLTNLLHEIEGAFESSGRLTPCDETGTPCDETGTPYNKNADLYTAIDRIRQSIAPLDKESEAGSNHLNSDLATSGQLTIAPGSDNSAVKYDNTTGLVRVEVGKLNRLMDHLARLVMLRNRRETEIASLGSLFGELASTASKVRSLGTSLTDLGQLEDAALASDVANDLHEIHRTLNLRIRPLSEGNSAVTTFISDFRRELTSLRRTPLSGLAQRIHRAVVDAAKLEDKEVKFEFVGKQERLETDLQQKLLDALIHVARNAVCHGIEPADQREQEGKPRRGTVTVSVTASPESLLFEVKDDGRGLAFESIHKKAIQLGLSGRNQALARDELARLILRPGFTTRNHVNPAAGRGIGLDVVASDIEKMRGWVDIQSSEGVGTTVRLHIPLPSLIQHVLLLRHQGQCYGVPMHSVRSTGPGKTNSPNIDLSAAFGLPHIENPFAVLIESQTQNSGEASEHFLGQFTLLAEEVIGPEEMVVRPLPEMLRSHPYISGITLSGAGESVLMLDPHLLAQSEKIGEGKSGPATALAPQPISNHSASNPSITPTAIVLSDSISTRRTVHRALERSQYQVRQFTNFKEASHFLRKHTAQLIFFDDRSRISHLIESVLEISDPSSLEATQFISIGHSPPASIAEAGFAIANVTRPIDAIKIREALNTLGCGTFPADSSEYPSKVKA
ncbi:MAG: ATP-binding protein [Rubripirellula sp.]|nr:ATP-binding protein [Rubripirellula sp.]